MDMDFVREYLEVSKLFLGFLLFPLTILTFVFFYTAYTELDALTRSRRFILASGFAFFSITLRIMLI